MPDLLLAATRCTRRNLEVILLPLYLPPCGQSCWPYAQGVCGMWPLLTTPSVTTWSKPSLLPTSPLCLWASLLSSWSCHSSQSGRVRRKSVPVTPWLQREQHFPPFTQSTSQGPLHGFLILEGLPLLPLSSCPMAPSTAAMFASVPRPHFSLMHLIQTSGPLHLLCALLGVLSPRLLHGSLTPLLQVSFNRDGPLTITVKILVPFMFPIYPLHSIFLHGTHHLTCNILLISFVHRLSPKTLACCLCFPCCIPRCLECRSWHIRGAQEVFVEFLKEWKNKFGEHYPEEGSWALEVNWRSRGRIWSWHL